MARGDHRTSVPVHGNRTLKIGTLRGILRDIEMSLTSLRNSGTSKPSRDAAERLFRWQLLKGEVTASRGHIDFTADGQYVGTSIGPTGQIDLPDLQRVRSRFDSIGLGW